MQNALVERFCQPLLSLPTPWHRVGVVRHVHRARRLRRQMTPAEVALWGALRRTNLGVRFRRQHAIGPFIVDFVSHATGLVIELDGQAHYEDHTDYEWRRTAFLEARGFHVLRFDNRELYEDLDGVVEKIREAIAAHPAPGFDASNP